MFLVDIACFPGSSGSPVLLLDLGSFYTKKGTFMGGSRVKLIGILYAGPQYTVEGEVQIVEVPVLQKPIVLSNIPNNLGLVIRSSKLVEFEDLFSET